MTTNSIVNLDDMYQTMLREEEIERKYDQFNRKERQLVRDFVERLAFPETQILALKIEMDRNSQENMITSGRRQLRNEIRANMRDEVINYKKKRLEIKVLRFVSLVLIGAYAISDLNGKFGKVPSLTNRVLRIKT